MLGLYWRFVLLPVSAWRVTYLSERPVVLNEIVRCNTPRASSPRIVRLAICWCRLDNSVRDVTLGLCRDYQHLLEQKSKKMDIMRIEIYQEIWSLKAGSKSGSVTLRVWPYTGYGFVILNSGSAGTDLANKICRFFNPNQPVPVLTKVQMAQLDQHSTWPSRLRCQFRRPEAASHNGGEKWNRGSRRL